MAIAERQAHQAGLSGPGTSNTIALTNNPLLGSLVIVTLWMTTNSSAMAVKDSANNSYTLTPSSPFTDFNNQTQWTAYLLSAPANATKTINFNWTGSDSVTAYVEEFTVSGGKVTWDKEATGNGATDPAVLPSITPTVSGSNIIYASSNTAGGFSHPTAGQVLSGWTGAGAGITALGSGAEYRFNASGATPVDYTGAGAVAYGGQANSFTFTPGVSTPPSVVGIVDDYQWIGGSSN